MSFKVIKPGFHSSIQDAGRFGFAHIGLSPSGVADEHAFCWGNYLLDNDFNDAVLEITFGACELIALSKISIAITGADLNFKLNDEPQENWQVLSVKQGDRLIWETPKSGVRAYLAVQGGFQTESFFNSRSVNVRENIGTMIKAGDELNCKPAESMSLNKTVPDCFKPDYQKTLSLRLLPGYQYDQFKQQQQILLNQTYVIDNASDRTGCRLKGKPIENIPSKMISEGIAYGSVEITTAGLPIILLKDRPTIGGYPKIGTVFSLDLSQLAQRHSGSNVRFKLFNVVDARKLRLQFDRFFR